MTVQEYINTVTAQIGNKIARAEVEAELSAHIQDRIEYYKNAGYTPPEAEQKALAHMGNGEEAGLKMNRLHGHKVMTVLAYITLGLFAGLFILAFHFNDELNYTAANGIFSLSIIIASIVYYLCTKISNSTLSLALSVGCFAWVVVFSLLLNGLILLLQSKYAIHDTVNAVVFALSNHLKHEADLLPFNILAEVINATNKLGLTVLGIVSFFFSRFVEGKDGSKYSRRRRKVYTNIKYLNLVFCAIVIGCHVCSLVMLIPYLR